MDAAQLLRVYAQRIANLDDDQVDEVEQELDAWAPLHTRDTLMDAVLDADQAQELARLDEELRARRGKIAPFLPPSNPPGREQWWWWLHEG